MWKRFFACGVVFLFLALVEGEWTRLAAGEPAPKYEWVLVNKAAPFAPRDGAGALSYKGRLWFIGGWNPIATYRKTFPRICNNEVWSSAEGGDWRLDRPNTFGVAPTFDSQADWEGRHTAGYAVFRDRLWIIGGDVNQGHYHSDVWSSTDGAKWTLENRDNPVPWGPRALHYTVVHDDHLWVIGGQTVPQFAKEEERFYRDVWKSADGKTWTQVVPEEPYWPQRGMIGGSAVLGGKIWILGGGTYDTPLRPKRQFMNDVWCSADGKKWEQVTPMAPWGARQYHDVAVWDNRLWVMEGYTEGIGNRNDVWYSENGKDWTELPNTPWKPRHAASVYVHNDALWMVAGNNMESDVWRLVRK